MEIIDKAIEKCVRFNLPFSEFLSQINKDFCDEKANDKKMVLSEFEKFAFFYLDSQCPEEVDQLAIEISEICFNWSSNFCENNKTFCLCLNRLAELKKRSVFALKVLVEFEKKYSLIKQWSPPVIQVTEKYLESLFNEIDCNLTSR